MKTRSDNEPNIASKVCYIARQTFAMSHISPQGKTVTSADGTRTQKHGEFGPHRGNLLWCPQRNCGIELSVQGRLFQLRQNHHAPATPGRTVPIVIRVTHTKRLIRGHWTSQICRWKHLVNVVVVVNGKPELLETILALSPSCRLSSQRGREVLSMKTQYFSEEVMIP